VQCAVKEWLPVLVDGTSRNFYDEAYELVTYSCNLIQWHYPPLGEKQNSLVVFEHCISQGPICEMLSESSTALQDSNLFMLITTLIMCASIYGNKDYKHLVYANWGTNRLGERAITQPRTRRELISSVVRAKGPSRNSSSKKNSDLESKKAKRENKPKKNKDSAEKTKVSEALSRIAFQTEIQNKINELQKSHQKIYNLDKFYTDINFLVICYMMIKGKAGNMTPGTIDETLDGIDLTWFERIAAELKSGKFNFSPTRQVQIPKPYKPGQFRTLAIGSPREKIVQKALQVILEAI
jgi:hypothetical protein